MEVNACAGFRFCRRLMGRSYMASTQAFLAPKTCRSVVRLSSVGLLLMSLFVFDWVWIARVAGPREVCSEEQRR